MDAEAVEALTNATGSAGWKVHRFSIGTGEGHGDTVQVEVVAMGSQVCVWAGRERALGGAALALPGGASSVLQEPEGGPVAGAETRLAAQARRLAAALRVPVLLLGAPPPAPSLEAALLAQLRARPDLYPSLRPAATADSAPAPA